MKKLSKVLALILCLAMIFTLCACGKSDSEKFVGKWECKVDMTDALLEGMEQELDEEMMSYFDFGTIYMVMTLDLSENGTYSMTLRLPEGVEEEFNTDLEDGLLALVDDIIQSEMEEYDVDRDILNEAYIEVYGCGIDEYYGELIYEIVAGIDINDMLTEATQEGNWKAEDGKLFMTDDLDAQFDGDSFDMYDNLTDTGFSITKEIIDGVEDTSLDYPLVFNKVG